MTHRSPETDFLNRDYDGFLSLLLQVVDRCRTEWTQRSAADPGVTILEALAYELDQLAYAGDRVAGVAAKLTTETCPTVVAGWTSRTTSDTGLR